MARKPSNAEKILSVFISLYIVFGILKVVLVLGNFATTTDNILLILLDGFSIFDTKVTVMSGTIAFGLIIVGGVIGGLIGLRKLAPKIMKL